MDVKYDALWSMVKEVREQHSRSRYRATKEELLEVNRYDSEAELESVLDGAKLKHYASADRYGGTDWIEFTDKFTGFYR